jgi:hypothetical protein
MMPAPQCTCMLCQWYAEDAAGAFQLAAMRTSKFSAKSPPLLAML